MGSKIITPKLMEQLLNDLESQNCKVKSTSNGYMIRFPNGDSTTWHQSPSDHRVVRNMRAIVKRAGLTWMLDS